MFSLGLHYGAPSSTHLSVPWHEHPSRALIYFTQYTLQPGSLGALVATLRAVDLRVDYAVRELGDIDIDATRDTIQRNMGWLRERANGPIRVGERRFSTHHIERLTTDGRQLNLSIPLLACSSILTCLENVRGAEGAYYIVGSVHHRLQKLSDPRAPIPLPGRIKAWREEIPISPASVRLRNGLLRVMALAHDAARQSELSDGAKGLIPGFLEDRLFETWCWAALYEALGGTETGQKAIGKLQIGDAELVASGLAGGKARCRILLQGWRDDSVLPSNYAPDFLVRYPMQRPILIDAKFRMASSCGEPCSADAFKEVQAYLDEFSLIGAIILVPTMPSSVAKGADSAGAVAVEGLSNGGLTKRVWGR